MGNYKDYATSLVATAPSPATTGTSLVVTAGQGTRFPSTPFYVTAHPVNEVPTLDNAEKLKVTAVSTDTFTIVREEGDTTAKSIAVGWRISNAVFTDDVAPNGWSSIVATPSVSTGYNKGNKEFEVVFDSDLSSMLSPGMRLKLDRGTAPPTQCTDLEASSSQYWSKASPAGITFTDDFTCEAWIKLESYTAGGIVARRNADTEGWSLSIAATGQVTLVALRTASNNRSISSAQAIPLGRWVHIAATMNLSANTHTMYIDGASVPFTNTLNGSITALTQGTSALVVGAEKSAGTNSFDGKITDVRVWDAVRTDTEIRDNMNQQLNGSETNLVAYFKLNGDADDSTSNNNDLSASGSATATNADNPMQSTEYGVITKINYSAPNTTVTLFTGTDHNIPNMTLNNPYYSTQSSPYGFPRGKDKWVVDMIVGTNATTTSSGYQNPNGLRISVPIGSWYLRMHGDMSQDNTVASGQYTEIALSTSSSSVSDSRLNQFYYIRTSSTSIHYAPFSFGGLITTTTDTTYYVVLKYAAGGGTITVGITGGLDGIATSTVVAECAYI